MQLRVLLGAHGGTQQQAHVLEHHVDGHQPVRRGGVHILHALAVLHQLFHVLVAGAIGQEAVELRDLLLRIEYPRLVQCAADPGKGVGIGTAVDAAHFQLLFIRLGSVHLSCHGLILRRTGLHRAAGLLRRLLAAGREHQRQHPYGHQHSCCFLHSVPPSVERLSPLRSLYQIDRGNTTEKFPDRMRPALSLQ